MSVTVTHSHVATGTDDGTGEVHKAEWNAAHVVSGDSAVGGSLVLLEQHTASSSSSLDFTSFISTDYDEYVFDVVGLVPSTNNVDFYMRFSVDGGTSYDSSAVYVNNSLVVANTGNVQLTSALAAVMARNSGEITNSAGYSVNASLRLFSPNSTSLHKHVVGNITWQGNSGGHNYINTMVDAHYGTTSAVNAVRFLFSSGTIASGAIRVFGVAKSSSVITGTGVDYDVSPNPTVDDDEFKTTTLGASWLTLGTPTAVDVNSTLRSHLYLKRNPVSSSSDISGIYRAAPAMPFTVTARLSDAVSGVINYQRGGQLLLGEAGGTGQFVSIETIHNGVTSGTLHVEVDKYSSRTSFGSNVSATAANTVSNPVYLRAVVHSSTNVDYYYSEAGYLWTPLAIGHNPGFTIAIVGLGVDPEQTTYAAEAVFDWIRFGSNVVQPESILWQNVGGGTTDSATVETDYDISPFPTTSDDEFKTTLTGWTVLGSLDVAASNDIPSNLRIAKTTSGFQIDGVYKSVPSLPFTVTAKVTDGYLVSGREIGLFVGEATPGKLWTFGTAYDAYYDSGTWTNRTTRSGFSSGSNLGRHARYLRLVVASSTSLDAYVSDNGRVWTRVLTGVNPLGGSTLASVGFFATAFAASPTEGVFDWIRFGNDVVQPDSLLWQHVGGSEASAVVSHSYVGYNTVGASTELVTSNRQLMKKVVIPTDSIVQSIGIYTQRLTSNEIISFSVGLLTDNGDVPQNVIAASTIGTAATTSGTYLGTGTARWVQAPLGIFVAAGTYWLAVTPQIITGSSHQIFYDTGSDVYQSQTASVRIDDVVSAPTNSGRNYSIRASIVDASAPPANTFVYGYRNFAEHQPYTFSRTPNGSFPDRNVAINGVSQAGLLTRPGYFDAPPEGSTGFRSGSAVGWRRTVGDLDGSNGVDVRVDLGTDRTIVRAEVIGAWNQSNQVTHPASIAVSYSDDDSIYHAFGSTISGMAADPGTLHPSYYALVVDAEAARHRYWKMRLIQNNSGTDDWLFIDRVRLWGTDSATESSSSATTVSEPITALLGAPDEQYGFDTAPIPGVALGTPTVEDSNTSVPSAYYVKKAATTGNPLTGRYFAKTAPFTVVIRVDDANDAGINYLRHAQLGVLNSTPSQAQAIERFWNPSAGNGAYIWAGVNYATLTGSPSAMSGATDRLSTGNFPFYLAIVVTTTTSVGYYTSANGRVWRAHKTGVNPGFTVANWFMAIHPENVSEDAFMAVGDVWVYNSAKTLPGGV